MHFWEFKEDHLRGYYLPVSRKNKTGNGILLITGIFHIIISLIKLVKSIIVGTGFLVVTIIRMLLDARK